MTDSIGLDEEDYFGVWGADVEMDGDVDFVLGRSTGPPLVLQTMGMVRLWRENFSAM